MRQATFRLVAIVVMALAAASHSIAQTYPVKPIRIVVGYSGSLVDLGARLLGSELSKRLGQPIIIEGLIGANGTIAAKAVANAAPDGYTLFFGSASNVHSVFNKNNAVDAAAEFAPISNIISSPYILFVNAKLPVNSVEELVAWSKANPEKANLGSAFATIKLLAEVLKARSGLVYTYISYKSSPQRDAALVTGEVSLTFTNPLPNLLTNVGEGKLRTMLIATAKRFPLLPNTPTAAELGIPNFVAAVNYGLWAPRNTPKQIIQNLSVEVLKVVNDPEIAPRFRQLFNVDPSGSTPEEHMLIHVAEMKFWQEGARLANYQPE